MYFVMNFFSTEFIFWIFSRGMLFYDPNELLFLKKLISSLNSYCTGSACFYCNFDFLFKKSLFITIKIALEILYGTGRALTAGLGSGIIDFLGKIDR